VKQNGTNKGWISCKSASFEVQEWKWRLDEGAAEDGLSAGPGAHYMLWKDKGQAQDLACRA
jgi:hypothetical protein